MFRTAQGKSISIKAASERIVQFILEDKESEYEITVGTDSQNFAYTKMVEVIAVHRRGRGGIYFYNIDNVPLITNLNQKINEETSRSLVVADELLSNLEELLFGQGYLIDELGISFQIHCDIGKYGKTRMLVREITRWVTGQGYVCIIKPYSYAASGIANKYSK